MTIFERVKALNLPLGEYVVFGSGPLAAQGIRESRDIDLLITKSLYEKLRNEGCDVSFWLDHIVDVPDKIKNAFPAEPRNDTQGVKVKTLDIKAGELIGYTNQEGSARFDFGALNLKGPQTSLTSNPRFKDDPIVMTSNKYRFATCPYDLYDSEKQKVYESLFDPTSDGDQEIIDNICL